MKTWTIEIKCSECGMTTGPMHHYTEQTSNVCIETAVDNGWKYKMINGEKIWVCVECKK